MKSKAEHNLSKNAASDNPEAKSYYEQKYVD